MPKILISDAMDKIAETILLSNNIKVDVKTNLSVEDLSDNIASYDGLIVRSATKVTKDIIDSTTNLKIIGRAGAGVDNIDIEAAKNKNIIVMNTPGGNTNATAEHTIGLIFAVLRKIPSANDTTHRGLWEKKKMKGNELKGKTIGIIGFGNVGKRISEIGLSLGMKISVFSNSFSSVKSQFPEINSLSFEKLLSTSDIISLHCKPTKDGKPLINLDQIKLMKKNSILINTARGGLIDENDLKIALESNLIRGAALDVYTKEPCKENVLFGMPNIILTPHIAASTNEAQVNVAKQIADQISNYFNKNLIINAI